MPQTRTPDAYYLSEVRYKGTKVVAVSPDYAEFCEFADTWLAPATGSESALAMAMGHVILNEYYWKKPEPFFLGYAKQFTDMPFVIFMDERDGYWEPGRFVNAADMGARAKNPEFNFYVLDAASGELTIPNGTMGDRWGNQR